MESTWLAPRFALVTCTQKLPDRYVFTASLPVEARANDPLILITLEVRQPWRAESRLVSTITDVLSQRYPTIRRSTNPLQSFELTLKNINEELMGLAEMGETEWIGRLNGVLALVIGNEVHVAQTGQATAYLFRQQKISQILERQDIADPHPLTTFANIISGYTNAGDRLVLGNEDLFTLIPLDVIRSAVSDETPWQAVQTLARSLKRTRVLSVAAAVLGIEQAKTWSEVGDEPIVVNLEEYTQSWAKKAWKVVKPVLIASREKAGAALKKTRAAASTGSEKWRQDVVPKARELWQSRVKSGERPATAIHDEADVEDALSAPTAKSAAASTARVKSARVRTAGALEKTYAFFKAGEHRLTLSVAGPIARFCSPLTRALSQLEDRSARLGTRLRGIPNIRQNRWPIFIIAVLLIGGATYSATQRQHAAQARAALTANDTQLEAASTEIAKMNSSIRLQENEEAAEHQQAAQAALDAVASPSTDQSTRQQQLIEQLATATDKLNNVTRLTSQGQHAISGTTSLAANNDRFVLSGQQGLQLLNRTSGAISSLSTASAVNGLTYDSDRALFVLRFADGSLGSLTSSGAAIEPVSVASGTAPAGLMRTFSRNLYIIDGSAGTLWKMAASGNGYAAAATVVADDSLKEATDLAIDGAIFILKSDDTVAKYSRGKLDAAFALKNVPNNVSFDRVFTDAQSDGIYLVDLAAGRISVFDKSGEYQQQYALDLTKLTDVTVDAAAKRVYALNDQQLVEYSF